MSAEKRGGYAPLETSEKRSKKVIVESDPEAKTSLAWHIKKANKPSELHREVREEKSQFYELVHRASRPLIGRLEGVMKSLAKEHGATWDELELVADSLLFDIEAGNLRMGEEQAAGAQALKRAREMGLGKGRSH